MSIQIRRANPQDIDNILSLVRDFVMSFEIVGPKFQQSYADIQENSDAIALVAADENALIGNCLGFCHHTFYANGNVAWLEDVQLTSQAACRRVSDDLLRRMG
jgi:hypothetical protein